MNKFNLGIVGCGDIAGYTALMCRLIPDIKLSACCDIHPDVAATFGKKHNIKSVYTNYQDMLNDQSINVLYLAVPHHLHAPMILDALNAGFPTLAEKPLTRTLIETQSILTAAQETKIKLGVNYQYRYDRACYQLVKNVQAGVLGIIHSVRINVPWRRTLDYFDNSPWHKSIAQAGGGTLITQGSHFLDIALWALQSKPQSSIAYTSSIQHDVEVDTLVQAMIQTESGTLISITSSMVSAKEAAVTIEFYGDRGNATYTNQPWPHTRFTIPKHYPKPSSYKLPVSGIHALHRSLKGFAKWVLHDLPFLTPAQETLNVMGAVDAVYRSSKSSQKTFIDI